MTFVLGTGRLGYDFLGTWTRRTDDSIEAPAGTRGDASTPGYTQPGTFMLLDEVKVLTVDVSVTPEQ